MWSVSSRSLSLGSGESKEAVWAGERYYPTRLAPWRCTGQIGWGSWVEIPQREQRNWLEVRRYNLGLD